MQIEPHRYRSRLLAIIVLTVVLGLFLAIEVESKSLVADHDHRLTRSGQTASRSDAIEETTRSVDAAGCRPSSPDLGSDVIALPSHCR